MILSLTLLANLAFAATPEASGTADVPAEARTALARAEAASSKVTALEARVAKLEKAKAKIVKVGADTSVIDAAIVQAKDELEKLATRAETAARKAEEAKTGAVAAQGKAEDAATRAEASAKRAEEAASKAPPAPLPMSDSLEVAPVPQSLDDAPSPNRDEAKPVFYGALGVGNGWMGRQETYADNGKGVYSLETTELMSNMLGGSVEVGVGGLGVNGRLSLSVRGEGMYNIGGGFAGFGEVVVGGFVEKTHSLRLEGFAGVSWETIPTDNPTGAAYAERRWDLGLAVEVLPVDHFGIWLGGRFLPDNTVNLVGTNAGEAEIALRVKY